MPLCIIHICGPSRCGKTAIAQLVANMLAPDTPHHLRLARAADGEKNFTTLVTQMEGMAESRYCTYLPERIFEQLPAALRAIKLQRRWATVLLETDTDPCHRNANEYDVRVFVAPAPRDPHDIFRNADEAARTMNTIMQDTLAFAEEIFGLTPEATLDESRSGMSAMQASNYGRTRDPMTETEIGRLMGSSMGRDLATRIALQPDYHPILESDVVVINTASGGNGTVLDDVAKRIEKLQSRLDRPPGREPMIAVCDVDDAGDPMTKVAVARVGKLVAEAQSLWP